MLLSVPTKRFLLILAVALFILPFTSNADIIIMGGRNIVVAQRGDSLSLIGARYGVDWQIVARENGFDPKGVCRPGQQFSINNLRIVPKIIQDGIIVNVPDRMLYFFRNRELVMAFPVGLGLSRKEWQTPIGPFLVVRKETDPTWYVPESIQREMKDKGQRVRTVVPPGKNNPLGRYALYTSLQSVLIHETIWPATVYTWRSHGCIRVSPEIMGKFYHQVERGAAGEIIYQPVSVAVQKGRVYLQVNKDIYRRIPSVDAEVRAGIEKQGLADSVDWVKVRDVTKKKTGIAEDVTR